MSQKIFLQSLLGEEVLQELQQNPQAEPSFYKNKKEIPGAVIYDLVTKEDKQGISVSIIVVQEEKSFHRHHRMVEILLGITGQTEALVGDEKYILTSGDIVMIPAGMKHKLRSLEAESSRVLYVSFPAWSREEMHVIDQANDQIERELAKVEN